MKKQNGRSSDLSPVCHAFPTRQGQWTIATNPNVLIGWTLAHDGAMHHRISKRGGITAAGTVEESHLVPFCARVSAPSLQGRATISFRKGMQFSRYAKTYMHKKMGASDIWSDACLELMYLY